MSKRDLLVWFIPAVMAVALSLLSTSWYGVGVTPDSVAYISSARSLVAGNGAVIYDGEPLVSWPPAFPTLIAIPGLAGVDALPAARFLNALFFGLIVLGGTLLLDKSLADRRLVFVGAMMLLLSEPLQIVSTRAWSEPLFIVLVVGFIFSMQKFVDSGAPTWLALAILIAALSPMTRYVGVTIIATGCLILLMRHGRRFRVRVLQSTLFLVLASLPVMFWLVRNYQLSGSLTGPRTPPEVTLIRDVGVAIGTLSEWFLPCALGIILFAWRASGEKTAQAEEPRSGHPEFVPAVFTIVYAVVLVVTAGLTRADAFDHRMLSPIYVPLLFLFLLWLDRRWGRSSSLSIKRAHPWTILAIILWLIWPCVDTGLRLRGYQRDGIRTFSTRAWVESELMKQVSELPADSHLYSNAPDAIYIHTRQMAVFSPFKREESALEGSYRQLDKFLGRLRADTASGLVWFTRVDRPYLFTVEELRSKCEVQLVTELADGALYSLRASR